MQVVNIKERKAKLSSYIRQVRNGETFLVADRHHVVARPGPVEPTGGVELELAARVAVIGARPPIRSWRPTDYARPGVPTKLTAAAIESLLNWARGESTAPGDR